MQLKIGFLGFFCGILIFFSITEATDARKPVPKTVENATLQTAIEYSVTGDVALKEGLGSDHAK
jgi:hypothetical protein